MAATARAEILRTIEDRPMSQRDEFHHSTTSTTACSASWRKASARGFRRRARDAVGVTIAPNAQGTMHHHPEEQWGVLLDGSAVRIQGGEEIEVKKGDFWRTPGNVPHTMRAGPEGARVLDIFSPPRPEYKKPGSGIGS